MIASFAEMGVKEMSAEDAWKLIEDADKDKDVHDIKQVCYAQAAYRGLSSVADRCYRPS